jgi:hypothetical protein
MASEGERNGSGFDDSSATGGPAAEPSGSDASAADGSAADAIVDDLDVPENPDEGTRAGAEAARLAVASTAPRRRYRGPRSILIMLFVLALVMVTGVYALFWYQRIKEQDDRGDLRKLEEREVMVRFQRRAAELKQGFYPPDAKVVLPAGIVFEPLAADEVGRMRQLQRRFPGGQYKPDAKQAMLIQEVHELEEARGLTPTSAVATPPGGPAAATAPASKPSDQP